MKTKMLTTVLLVTTLFFVLFSCNKGDNINPARISLSLTDTEGVSAKVTLGRVLFYDQHLSLNNSISCGSCHKQSLAFSDNVAFSNGFENQPTLRNSLPIQNLGSSFGPQKLFWDGRENLLTTMVLKPIVNHVEMGMSNVVAVAERVKVQGYYAPLFSSVYGSSEITSDKIADALSAFVSSIIANKSRFDRANAGQLILTADEQRGENLFFNKYQCNSCHHAQFPSGYNHDPGTGGFVNIGLDNNYTDNGLGAITNNATDNGKFKIPNLHNVALTAPYMHDGRFATLEQVLDHYSNGIKNHPNLDGRLMRGVDPLQMDITSHDKQDIITFLNAMTDSVMIADPRLSNPFKAH